jgi:hypothetical protein
MKHSYLAAVTAAEIDDSPDDEVIGRSCSEPEMFALLFQWHSARIGLYAARRLGPGPARTPSPRRSSRRSGTVAVTTRQA